jgi:nucleotide-binding universal stress UspA family protein
MTPHSLLAVTDFSSQGDHALARAGHLCAEHRATLKLLCVAYPGEPPPPDAACRLAHHALQLHQRHGIRVRALNQIAFSNDDVLAAARSADLLVWGTARARGVRAFLTGQPVEAVLRQCRRPVLVVRRPAEAPYRRLVFALNQHADVELFHAISTANEGKLRYAEVSEHAVKVYRDQCRRYAQDRMFWLTDSYEARRNRVLSAIGHGDPARQVLVQQQRSGAELVVVGKHPASALSDFVFGSVAQRVLDRVSGSDVLVVPHDSEPASSATAVERLASEPRAVRRLRAGVGAAARPSAPRAGV